MDNETAAMLSNSTADPEVLQYTVNQFCANFVFYFNVFGIGIICFIGLLGNTTSLIVLGRERSSKSALLLLQALAIADNLLLITSLLSLTVISTLIPHFYGPRSDEAMIAHAYFVVYVNPIGMMVKGCNMWMTAILALNRFIVIRLPLKAASLCTAKASWVQIITVYTAAVVLNLPKFWQTDIAVRINDATGNLIPYPIQTDFGYKTTPGMIYNNIVDSFLMMILPLALLIIFTILLVYTIKRLGNNQFLSRSKDRANEKRITTVMLVVIAICVMCHLPERIYAIAKSITKITPTGCVGSATGKGSRAFFIIAYVVNILVVINSAVNFIIYCSLRKKFRQNMVLMCCWKCASEEYLIQAHRQSGRGSGKGVPSLKTGTTGSLMGSTRPWHQRRGMSVDSNTSFTTASPMSPDNGTPMTPMTATSNLKFNFRKD